MEPPCKHHQSEEQPASQACLGDKVGDSAGAECAVQCAVPKVLVGAVEAEPKGAHAGGTRHVIPAGAALQMMWCVGGREGALWVGLAAVVGGQCGAGC